MRLLMKSPTKMRMVVVMLAALTLAVCMSTAASASALDYINGSYVDDGIGRDLVLNGETGAGLYAIIPGATIVFNAAQPNFTYGSFTGYGVCIDWSKPLDDKIPGNSNYKVYSWTKAVTEGRIGTINSSNKDTIWNQLTTMWTCQWRSESVPIMAV